MAIKPEDKPKLIGLVVALVGVLAYVLIALVPKLTAGAEPAPHVDPPPPAALTAAAAAATQTPGQGPNGEASGVLPDEDSTPIPPPPSRDSFTPPPATHTGPDVAGGHGQQRPGFVGPSVPTAQTSIRPITPGGIAVAPAVPSAPPPPLPAVELKGVILGEPSVAVISVNGEVVERQVGETIATGLRLAKISEVGITVVNGKHYLPVTVGHAMVAPPVQAPPQAQPGSKPTSQAPVQPQTAATLVKTAQ